MWLDIFCMDNTKNYENYKKLVQKWERKTNKQTKQSTKEKQNKGTIIKQTKRLIAI